MMNNEMMKWTEDDQLKLIEVYKTKTILWDPRHNDHFKKSLKEEAWMEVGNEMNIPADQCKKKMVCLLASNRRERNKVKSSLRSSEIYRSRWFAYDSMEFLRDRIYPNNKTEALLDGYDDETPTQEDIEEDVRNKRSYQNGASYAAPIYHKRAKIKDNRSEGSSLMASAFQLLQTATEIIAPPSEDDEVTAFFKYVTTKVKSYPPDTRKSIQKTVFDILMRADEEVSQWAHENGDSVRFPVAQIAPSPSQRSQSSEESHAVFS